MIPAFHDAQKHVPSDSNTSTCSKSAPFLLPFHMIHFLFHFPIPPPIISTVHLSEVKIIFGYL